MSDASERAIDVASESGNEILGQNVERDAVPLLVTWNFDRWRYPGVAAAAWRGSAWAGDSEPHLQWKSIGARTQNIQLNSGHAGRRPTTCPVAGRVENEKVRARAARAASGHPKRRVARAIWSGAGLIYREVTGRTDLPTLFRPIVEVIDMIDDDCRSRHGP